MPDRIRGKASDQEALLAILSDTHGDNRAISQILALQGGPDSLDALVHLGDMESADWIANASASIPVYAVAGNNDPRRAGLPACTVFDAGVLRFVCVHGQLQQVKSTLSMLLSLADSCHADVVAYGHTHGSRPVRYSQALSISPELTEVPCHDIVFQADFCPRQKNSFYSRPKGEGEYGQRFSFDQIGCSARSFREGHAGETPAQFRQGGLRQ